LGDTRTPTEVATVVLFLNTAVGMILVGPYGVAGLAATLSATSACQAAMLLWLLRRKLGRIQMRMVLGALLKQGLAASAMGLLVYALASLGEWNLGPSAWMNIVILGACIVVGVITYAGFTWVLGCPETRILVEALARRRRSPGVS